MPFASTLEVLSWQQVQYFGLERLCGHAGPGPAEPAASTSQPAAAADSSGPSASTDIRTAWAGVDESSPTTSIQLRLHDGSRMVARFNLTHSVADIRRFIQASRPDMPANYRLMTSFPTKPVEEDGKSIEAAGLANSVLVQKVS